MGKSISKHSSSKPKKPCDGFPLFPHATGRWARKIRQRLVSFGLITDDPEGTAALARLNRDWPHLKEGRRPPQRSSRPSS